MKDQDLLPPNSTCDAFRVQLSAMRDGEHRSAGGQLARQGASVTSGHLHSEGVGGVGQASSPLPLFLLLPPFLHLLIQLGACEVDVKLIVRRRHLPFVLVRLHNY